MGCCCCCSCKPLGAVKVDDFLDMDDHGKVVRIQGLWNVTNIGTQWVGWETVLVDEGSILYKWKEYQRGHYIGTQSYGYRLQFYRDPANPERTYINGWGDYIKSYDASKGELIVVHNGIGPCGEEVIVSWTGQGSPSTWTPMQRKAAELKVNEHTSLQIETSNSNQVGEVREWLRDIGLAEYTSVFKAQGYESKQDMDSLTADDLKAIGVRKHLHVKKIMAKVGEIEGVDGGEGGHTYA